MNNKADVFIPHPSSLIPEEQSGGAFPKASGRIMFEGMRDEG